MTTSSRLPTIIGLAGSNGAGKDTVAEMLADRHGYLFVSTSELLREELKRRGLKVIRKNTSLLSAEWRREFGMGVLVDKCYEFYKNSTGEHNGFVVGSLRHPSEVDAVHNIGGIVVWVDADPRVRYGRIQANAASRSRAGEDNKSFEEWFADEQREMHPEGDAATLNMSAVRDRADITLMNDGDDLEEFKQQAEKALNISQS